MNRLKWSGLAVALWLGATLPLAWASTGGTRASFSDSETVSGEVQAAAVFGASATATPSAARTVHVTRTATRTRTVTVTPSVSPSVTPSVTRTATVTPSVTPVGCDHDGRGRLELDPADVGVAAEGRFSGSIVLSDGDESTERDVLLGLQAADDTWAFDRVEFANGQIWQIFAGAASTLYLAGDVPPGASVSISFTLYVRPGWLEARPGSRAGITVGVARRDCRHYDPKHHLTIEIERDGDAVRGDTATAPPTASYTPAPTATATVTASATPAPTITPTPTDTPQPTATVTPIDTPEPTATATPTETATPTPTAMPAVTPTATAVDAPEPTATTAPTDTPVPTPASETPTPSVTASPPSG